MTVDKDQNLFLRDTVDSSRAFNSRILINLTMLWSPLLMLTTPNRKDKEKAGLIRDEVLGRGWD